MADFFNDIGLLPIQPNIGGLQQLNRMQNIFGPPSDPFGSMQPLPMFGGPQPFDMQSRMQELYQPRMEMQNRFNSFLDAFPEPTQPSMLRKIGAALYGMSTNDPYKAAQQFAYGPYFNELERYKAQVGPLQQAADNERLMNAQDRQWAQNVTSQEMAQRRLDESERAARARVDIQQQREDRLLKHNQAKIELADWKARNPNGIVKEGADGFLYVVNPQTGAEIKTNVEHGRLTDLERINLTAAHAMDRVVTQQEGANQRNAAAIAGANQRNAATIEGANTRASSRTNPLTRPMTPTAERAAKINRARTWINEHPEDAQWIDINTGIVKPAKDPNSWFSRGPSFEQRNRMVEFIEGKTNAGITTRNTVPNNQQPNSTANQAVNSAPKVGDTKTFPNGRIGKWDGKGWVAQ